jgi:histidinol-phosphatase (PHP family)
MITVDLHSHTRHSHARDSVEAMAAGAFAKGLAVFGLSEHSLRPPGYSYPKDYQAQLAAGFSAYIDEARAEQARYAGRMRVLLGLELDYIPDEEAFARAVCAEYPYDYIIGGLHFQGPWGFDGGPEGWEGLSDAACRAHFVRYYEDLARMAETGLFQIAAHPDLIKLFRRDAFHAWLEKPASLALVETALRAMKAAGMALEVSSAALRKGLGEPYPAEPVMRVAASVQLPISFGSDAHAAADVAWGFDQLAAYARSFGYTDSVWFAGRAMRTRPFI